MYSARGWKFIFLSFGKNIVVCFEKANGVEIKNLLKVFFLIFKFEIF